MLRSETVRENELPPVTVPRDLELIDLVHRGTETEIWQTRQRQTGELICWKGLRGPGGEHPAALQRLHHERRVLADVNSCHVVSLAAGSRGDDPPGLRLRWLPGESLQSRLARTQLLPVETTVWIARQVAQGMEALLATGWLHGAIAPRHVRLSPTGEVTLVDLSAAFPDELQATLPEPTAGGMEPLSARGTGRRGHRREADLQDLGRLLWRLLAGTTVPECDQELVTLTSELRRRVPELPRDLVALTTRLLTAENWPRGVGLRDVIRPLVGCELRCLLAESAETVRGRPPGSPSAASPGGEGAVKSVLRWTFGESPATTGTQGRLSFAACQRVFD
jgi:serine/threonine protein kinase